MAVKVRDCKVLIVDDEKVILLVLAELFFEEMGVKNVLTAKNGLEALDIIKKEEINLIISDNNMPELTGLELLKAVRKDNDKNISRIFFILTSALPGDTIQKKAKTAGVNAFLEKPFNFIELRDIVKRVIEKI